MTAIVIKTNQEIKYLRESNRVVALLLQYLASIVRPGVTTAYLDHQAERFIYKHGAVPGFKGYMGYPATVCISINDEVVHGIPSPKRVIKEGDIVSIDAGVILKGFYGDAAITVPVGEVPPETRKLLQVTEEALYKGIEAAVVGNRVGDIGYAVQQWVEKHGFSVVRDYTGHGIGRKLHEPPQVPNYGERGKGILLRPGMTIAIEPMVNAGGFEVETMDDGWTVVTADHSLSAHFEHTIAIMEDGTEILSRP